MEICSDLNALRHKRLPIVMAAGFFDGLHLGHQRVIRNTINAARTTGGKAWVLTFGNHPLSVTRPGGGPPLLTTIEHKLRLFADMKVDGCLVIPFTKELSGLEPRVFIDGLIKGIPSLRSIFVGENWRFGKNGAGDTGLLARICQEEGIRVRIVRPVKRKGKVISSTAIRAALSEGDFPQVIGMMGRYYSFVGRVVRGRTVGRELGFPTANLDTGGTVLFPGGVYAVKARKHKGGRRMMDGVLNFGSRPTFTGPRKISPTLEMHLLGTRQDLYNSLLEVFLIQRMRDEKKFPSEPELQEQIGLDVLKAEKILREIALHA